MLKIRADFTGIASALVFAGIGLLHGFIGYQGLEYIIAGYAIPAWLSYTVVGLSFLLAIGSLTNAD